MFKALSALFERSGNSFWKNDSKGETIAEESFDRVPRTIFQTVSRSGCWPSFYSREGTRYRQPCPDYDLLGTSIENNNADYVKR